MALICYHGDNPHIINQERADIILESIANPDRRKIISTIKNKFKTANQIAKDVELPISTVYRRIRELNDKNVLIVQARITKKGKKEFSYKSKVRKVVFTFEDNMLDVQIYTNLRD